MDSMKVDGAGSKDPHEINIYNNAQDITATWEY